MPRRQSKPRPRHDRRKSAPEDKRRAAKIPHIPQEQVDILRARLGALGARNLAEYRAGAHWQRVIGWWERDPLMGKACVVCGSFHYELHHRTYARLGRERPTDLVPLCSVHHKAAHELIAARVPGVTLWNAHRKLTHP